MRLRFARMNGRTTMDDLILWAVIVFSLVLGLVGGLP
jgi:hypothetical protein